MLRFKGTGKHSSSLRPRLVQCGIESSVGEEVGRWKGSQGSDGKGSWHLRCVLFVLLLQIPRWGAKSCLAILCIMAGLDYHHLLPLHKRTYWLLVIIQMLETQPSEQKTCLSIAGCMNYKKLQCLRTLPWFEGVNTAVYKHCQSISSRGKPQSDLSGYLSSLKTR